MLDIGCGTGTFAIELADLCPSALIEATDLSPMQPSYGPAKVNFIIDDPEQEDWAVPTGFMILYIPASCSEASEGIKT